MQKIRAKILITIIINLFLLFLVIPAFLNFPVVTKAQVTDSNGNDIGFNLSSLFPFLLGVIGGAVASIINYFVTERSEKNKANRDYQYQALLNLYKECDPLIFQLARSSEGALFKIKDIVEDSNNLELNIAQRLGDPNPRNYYKTNVIYRLLKPAAIFKLLEEKLTSYDFENEPRIKFYYDVSKALFYSFTSGKKIAEQANNLEYKRKDDNKRSDLRQSELDILCELLIKRDDKSTRIAQYTEFLEAWREKREPVDPTRKAVASINSIFTDFDPNDPDMSKTITWKILLIQAQIHIILQRNILQFKKGKFRPLFPSMWLNEEKKQTSSLLRFQQLSIPLVNKVIPFFHESEEKEYKSWKMIAEWRIDKNKGEEAEREREFVYKYLRKNIDNWSFHYKNSCKDESTIPSEIDKNVK